MSNLINLNYTIHSVRVELINGEPWFCLSDVCEILELGNASRVVDRLDIDGVTKSNIIDNLGRKQEVNFINEPNLYAVVFRSNKPEAVKFRKWVFNEVLPTIRKTGQYSITPQPQPTVISEYMSRELRNMMMNIVRYFRNSSNQVSANLWNIIKAQLHIQRIADMSMVDYPIVMDWLSQFHEAAYQNYLRECEVENQLIKVSASIKLEKLQDFRQLQEKVGKNAKVLTLL